MITEKSEANAGATPPADSKTVVVVANQQQVHHGRQSSVLMGHHHQPPAPPPSHHQPAQPQHNQQSPLQHHNRSGSSLSATDYREPAIASTVIALESAAGSVGGARRMVVNGSVVPGVICGGGPAHSTHAAVCYPRPIYPFPLPLTNPTGLWHHAQPHFPTSSVTFPPFIENEWSRHCRLPMFNRELQPEPVNLQNNNHHHHHHHHRRPDTGRAPLEIAARLQQERAAHNRPAPANPPAHDDREQTRHHA